MAASKARTVVDIHLHELPQELMQGSGEDWKLQIFDELTTYEPDVERESKRLAILKRYGILDSEREIDFDELTRVAKDMFNVPIAVVSLVDFGRQWFKSIQGMEAQETPRCLSFCTHVASAKNHDRCFVVTDASQDFRFKDNPLVAGGPKVRFYAGAPLFSPEKEILGSICIIDFTPRQFSERDQERLLQLASEAVYNMITRLNI